MGVVVLCRFISTIGLVSCLKLCRYESKHHNPLNYKELVFIWYSGLIRGAIAFGLVLRIEDSFAGRDLIVTTCLSLVVITTIIFGSTVSLVSYCLFGDIHKPVKKEEGQNESSANLIDETNNDLGESSSSESSDRSGFQGPNVRPMSESQVSASMLNSHVDDYNRVQAGSQEASGSRRGSVVNRKRKSCGSYL